MVFLIVFVDIFWPRNYHYSTGVSVFGTSASPFFRARIYSICTQFLVAAFLCLFPKCVHTPIPLVSVTKWAQKTNRSAVVYTVRCVCAFCCSYCSECMWHFFRATFSKRLQAQFNCVHSPKPISGHARMCVCGQFSHSCRSIEWKATRNKTQRRKNVASSASSPECICRIQFYCTRFVEPKRYIAQWNLCDSTMKWKQRIKRMHTVHGTAAGWLV